jgi:peptide/nickel transport system permease protein
MKYAARRVVYLLFIVLAVTFLITLMIDLLPGDPARALLPPDATPAQVKAVTKQLNLDQGAVPRYIDWLGNAVHGDFGRSLVTNQPVIDAIGERLPVSLELVVVAQLLALLFAFPTAIYGAYRPDGFVDNTSRVVSSFFISIPNFVFAIVAVEVFAVSLGWLPAVGFTRLTDDPWGNLQTIILPAIIIAAEPAGVYQRLFRTDMGATLNENYIEFARAKGLGPGYILRRHAIRPSMFSLATIVGINTAKLIGGAIIIETIFSLPGVGRLLIDSITSRDFPMLQGVVAVITIGYVVMNIGVDVIYGFLDPRVRDGAH